MRKARYHEYHYGFSYRLPWTLCDGVAANPEESYEIFREIALVEMSIHMNDEKLLGDWRWPWLEGMRGNQWHWKICHALKQSSVPETHDALRNVLAAWLKESWDGGFNSGPIYYTNPYAFKRGDYVQCFYPK